MTTRRWGLTIGADGMMHTSICRAKKPGTGRCHHFTHVRDAETAQRYITLHQMQPDLTKIVNYDRDVKSINGAIRDYLEDRGIKIEYAPDDENVSVIDSWFHGDRKLAKKILGDAQESGVIPKIEAAKSVREDVGDLVRDGVKIRVEGDRFTGMNPDKDSDLDSDVWMTANGITSRFLDGDAPVTIMVADGKDENAAISNVRSNWSNDSEDDNLLSEKRKKDFATAGYASLHGRTI
jgi:hypothetical protein